MGNPTSVLKIIPLKENHGLVGILGVAEQIPSLTSTLTTRGAVLIEAGLSPFVVLNFVADEQVWHKPSSFPRSPSWAVVEKLV